MPHNAGQDALAERNASANNPGFQPGVSGNPRGRPRKADSITAIMWEVAERKSPKDPSKTNIERVVELLFERAQTTGKQAQDATEEILNRLLGRPAQSIALTQGLDDETAALLSGLSAALAGRPSPALPGATIDGDVVVQAEADGD